MIAISSLVKGLSAPYLCRKDGVTLQCPHVKESSSLWENPLSATASWKPCAERREVINSDLPAENESNGYIFIHAEGGLNQQRIAITKEELATKLELDEFRKHVTSLAALDFLVCLKSDVFVMTHGGNFAKLIFGHRRYMGHRLKSTKPDKGIMTRSSPTRHEPVYRKKLSLTMTFGRPL